MRVLRQRRIALTLLLAALAQPAWGVAHAAGHAHLAGHHGRVAPDPGASPVPDASGTQALASPEPSHRHEHLVAVYLRSTRSTDAPQTATLPSAAPAPSVVAGRSGRLPRSATPSHAGPEASGAAGPRAPPTA